MRKVVVGIVAVFILLPLIPRLFPPALTFDAIQKGFEKAGMSVSDVNEGGSSYMRGATGQLTMVVDGAQVTVCQFEDRGAIAVAQENQKTDPGTAIVQAWGLADAMGAAKPSAPPSSSARRGFLLLVVTSEDAGTRERIVNTFTSMPAPR